MFNDLLSMRLMSHPQHRVKAAAKGIDGSSASADYAAKVKTASNSSKKKKKGKKKKNDDDDDCMLIKILNNI